MPWNDDENEKLRKRWGINPRKGSEKEEPESIGAKLDELLQRAEPLIEQLNNLYARFFSGVEKLPPHERRKQLDQLMSQLQLMPKPNPTYRFRVDTINTRFITFRERWDKMLRDLESGKIKRRAD